MPPKKRPRKVGPKPKAEVEKDIFPVSKPELQKRQKSETCGACLLPVDEKEKSVGLIDSCSHIFHHDCAKQWSKTENSCPQCKQRFFWLAAYSWKGKRLSLERIERRNQEGEEDAAFEDVQFCEHCKEIGDESKLLLCDGMHGTCNAAYHFTCVGLSAVPRGAWFCPDCLERGYDVDAHGRRGEKPAQAAMRRPAAISVAVNSPNRGSSASSTEPQVASPARTRAESQATSGRGRGRGQVPSQLRLSALACITPVVPVPALASGGSGRQPEGLYATFAARRRGRGGDRGRGRGEASFISLNPTYEEDFMGKSLGD